MTKTEMVQALWAHVRQPNHSLEDLEQILEVYKDTVADFASSSPEYRKALLHTHEEFPDLQRLVGKKHDAVLRGRLIDAITSLKKKVADIESPVLPGTDEAEPPKPAVEGEEGEKPKFRILPSLGMD